MLWKYLRGVSEVGEGKWGGGGGWVGWRYFLGKILLKIPAAISGRRKSHKLLVASIWKDIEGCNYMYGCLPFYKKFPENVVGNKSK